MSLARIAAALRTDALANLGEIQTHVLPNKAACSLYVKTLSSTEVEWHLRIERPGKLPLESSREYLAWLRELNTFRDERFFNVPAQVVAEMKETPNHRHYAAVMVWVEFVEMEDEVKPTAGGYTPMDIPPLPATPQELRAWAETLGQGIQIRGVNVFTGEM